MRRTTLGATLVSMLAITGVAAAQSAAAPHESDQSDVTASPTGENGSPQINATDNCYTMKQRVMSVMNDRAAVVGRPGGPNPVKTNNSGNTARSDVAKHDISAGDRACEHDDLAAARQYYQHAIDELVARR